MICDSGNLGNEGPSRYCPSRSKHLVHSRAPLSQCALTNCYGVCDRDSIFSSELDQELKLTFGLKVLRTPVRAPQANAHCERLIGTVRRECLDFVIPRNERHLRRTLRSYVAHYNKGRPHSSLGPGISARTPSRALVLQQQRHRLPRDCQIRVEDILGGLHHEYWLEERVA